MKKIYLLPLIAALALAACQAETPEEQETSPSVADASVSPASADTADTTAPKATEEEAASPPSRHAMVLDGRRLLDIRPMIQDELESGCEVYSAVMLLHYYGFDLDEFRFAEEYLDVEPNYIGDDGSYYGPDLNSAFAGEVEWGYGAYAPTLAKAINRYLSDEDSALDAVFKKEWTLEELRETCLDQDIPAMVWLTTDMALPEDSISWIVDYVDENAEYEIGDEISWPVNEHCMVLCGYDDESYYFADPLAGEIVPYDAETCDEVFEALGGQAVFLK